MNQRRTGLIVAIVAVVAVMIIAVTAVAVVLLLRSANSPSAAEESEALVVLAEETTEAAQHEVTVAAEPPTNTAPIGDWLSPSEQARAAASSGASDCGPRRGFGQDHAWLPDGTDICGQPIECDGRGILILESVMVGEGIDISSTIGNSVDKWSRTVSGETVHFTNPGRCPSLRASLGNEDIYPVFVDYGFDTSRLCQGLSTYGGNARTVSDRVEYLSPC
ncbi:hypothetical protein [Corynebacterium sputi]|uniref:hypothetical protein n=1 Tax=Corynebacterium sputi TaxID=489915 RepID=UPI000479EFBB|nr:hypothetical protein [Corynebacterium sputi]